MTSTTREEMLAIWWDMSHIEQRNASLSSVEQQKAGCQGPVQSLCAFNPLTVLLSSCVTSANLSLTCLKTDAPVSAPPAAPPPAPRDAQLLSSRGCVCGT